MNSPNKTRIYGWLVAWSLTLTAASGALAQAAFDTGSTLSRNVVIWIDNNVNDPSSVGNDLEFAFNGVWTSDGTTGTIVVDSDDVVAAFPTSGLPGTPAQVAGWSDLTITIEIASGAIQSMTQSGSLAIAGLGDQPFSYDLNSTQFDTTTSSSYSQTGFAEVTFGPETFVGWCTDGNAGQIGGLACPPFAGPAPFGYNSATGRFNSIGATNLNDIIFAYSTFGDGQLFEEATPAPGVGGLPALILVSVIGTAGLLHRKRSVSAA